MFPPGVPIPPDGDDAWVCEEEGKMFHLNLPDSYFKRMGAKSGHTRMRVSNAYRSAGTSNKPPTLDIPSSVVPEFSPDDSDNRRKLIPTTGTFSTLVARVYSNDDEPNRSAATISQDVFSDSMNFAKLMSDCSADKAQYVPATGGDIVGGVSNVYINRNTQNVDRFTVEDAAIDAILAKFTNAELNSFDAIIIILPFNGESNLFLHSSLTYATILVVNFGGAAAYAYINGGISVYHDENGSSPGILLHEVGKTTHLSSTTLFC